MKNYYLIIFLFLYGCSENSIAKIKFEDPVYTEKIDFFGMGRVNYEKTGPDWETENVFVGETLFLIGDEPYIDENGYLITSINEMAVYSSSSTPIITFSPAYSGETTIPAGTYFLKGVLIASDDSTSILFSKSGDLTIENNLYEPVTIESTQLAQNTAKLYQLEITHKYTIDGTEYSSITKQDFAQLWRYPLVTAILYKKIIKWGCEWIDGYYEDTGEPAENLLSEKLLYGMANLVALGYRYGSLIRPEGDEYTNRPEVFLDFKQSACGEFYGFFMDLVEIQGIDAQHLFFAFLNPGTDRFSMYETIEIAALGRETKVWRYQDHAVVEINGRVYDPTYLIIKENADAYEDFMFRSFCYGEESNCGRDSPWCLIPGGPQGICIYNPPGYDPNIGLSRVRGEFF
jgi:hypothetical protein